MRHPHRAARIILLAGLGVGLTIAGGIAAAQQGPGGGGPSTATQEKGIKAGAPFADPKTLVVKNGKATLTAKVTRFKLGGRSITGLGYNGSFTGPTIKVAPGQKLALTLKNKLPVVTNLHFHGLHLSPEGTADNVFLEIARAKSLTYNLAFPADQALGTYWYHDHDMVMDTSLAGSRPTATVGSDPESEIEAGLAGTILVGDDRTLLSPALRHIAAHTMVLKDAQITSGGRIVQNTSGQGGLNYGDPTVRFVNGQLRPVLKMKPGETQLWRLANEGANIVYDLKLAGVKFTVIARDGVPAAKITTADHLVLAPGGRYDLLVTAPAKPQTIWLNTLRNNYGDHDSAYPAARMLAVKVSGTAVTPTAMPTGAMPTAPADLSAAPIAQSRTLTLTDNGPTMEINGKTFDPDHSIFATPGVVGTVEQWTIVNKTDGAHPFHVHTNQFQVMSINGTPQPYTSVADTFPVPSNSTVVVRLRLADYTGRWMFHCHIAAHEDQGMMSYLNVVAAS